MNEEWFEADGVEELCDSIEGKLSGLRTRYDGLEYSDEEELSSRFAFLLEKAVDNHQLTPKPRFTMSPTASSTQPVTLHAKIHGLKARPLTRKSREAEEAKLIVPTSLVTMLIATAASLLRSLWSAGFSPASSVLA